jgi:hypothetical protein
MNLYKMIYYHSEPKYGNNIFIQYNLETGFLALF